MSLSSKPFTIGKDLSAIQITPITRSSSGVITLGTAQSLKGYVDGIDLQILKGTDRIMPVDATQPHTVTLWTDYRLVITERKRRRTANATGTAANGSVLPWVAANYDEVMITFTQCTVNGAASTGEVYVCYGAWTDFNDGTRGQGSQATSLVIEPIAVIDSDLGELPAVSVDLTPTS